MRSAAIINPSTPAEAAARAALDRLERLLAQDPGDAVLLAQAADAALAAGALERAQQLIESGRRLSAGGSVWRFRQSSLHIARRELDQARAVLGALQQEGLRHPLIAHNLARLASIEGDFGACLEILRPWVDSEAGRSDSALQMLWLRALHRLERFNEAWQWARQRLTEGSLSPHAAAVASLVAIDVADLEAALALSQQALDAGEPPLEALVARACVALHQGDGAQARELLEAALELNPKEGRTWSALGFVALLEQRLSEARLVFERTLVLLPAHIETWHGLGWCRLLQHELAGAVKAFEAALRLDPGFAESHGALAVAQALQQQGQSAREHLARALELEPWNLAAHYAQALLSGQTGDLPAVERLARRYLGRSSWRGR